MASLFIFKSPLLYFSHILLLVSAEDAKSLPSFDCGYLGRIMFPFTTTQQPHCGVLAIRGCEEHEPRSSKTIQLASKWSTILWVEPRTIVIQDDELDHYLQTRNCTAFNNKSTLPSTSPLASFYIKYSITLFNCNHSLGVSLPKDYHEYSRCSGYNIYYGTPHAYLPPGFNWPSSLAPCSMIQLALSDNSTENPYQFLSGVNAVVVRLSDYCEHCLAGKGQCLVDSNGKLYCVKETKHSVCNLALGIVLCSIIMIIIIGLLIIRHCKTRGVSDSYSNPDPENTSIYFGAPLFTYKDLEVATTSFDRSRQIGEGGFGIVYYGKLQDGREVAVKYLYEHNYRSVEQFMNEIKILTRLRHKNLVSLYGCTSLQSSGLLLVYEYVSNGTVASHLHHESTNTSFLPWPIRMKVAIETAAALAYLHESDIIHRDVKTNNILLDNTFCVKVADFGLSRLLSKDVSHVSTAPQGTPGYFDPEYYQCFQLTNKSDVFSFGVVLIELISAMTAIDLTRHEDEINLADLAIRKIQNSALAELVDPSLGFESNSDIKGQIASVAELAFQCLQPNKELRPSMNEVLEVLRRIGSWKNEPGHPAEVNVDADGEG